jgi:hypothetical protein
VRPSCLRATGDLLLSSSGEPDWLLHCRLEPRVNGLTAQRLAALRTLLMVYEIEGNLQNSATR